MEVLGVFGSDGGFDFFSFGSHGDPHFFVLDSDGDPDSFTFGSDGDGGTDFFVFGPVFFTCEEMVFPLNV